MLQPNKETDLSNFTTIQLEELVVQLEKDLRHSGEIYEFKKLNAEGLSEELTSLLSKLDRGSRLENILYRVDVNLNKIDTRLPHYQGLSRLIWNRIFQKVWFRKNF